VRDVDLRESLMRRQCRTAIRRPEPAYVGDAHQWFTEDHGFIVRANRRLVVRA
jgi:hypothetical protein